MKKNSSISKKNVFLRASAFVFAAVMLFLAAACSDNETEEVSSENTLTELKIEELDQDMTNFLIRFTDWYEVEEGKKPVYDSKKAGDGETNILRSILGDAGCADWTKYPVSEPEDVYNTKKLDPKKWAKKTGGAYKVFDSKDADWIAVNIFNVTEKDIEAMREQGEKNK